MSNIVIESVVGPDGTLHLDVPIGIENANQPVRVVIEAARNRSGAMSTFVVELPAELQAEVARRVGQQPGGESAWVADAVREKIKACAELEYLKARAARGNREAYDRVLSKVPAAPPVPGDERDPSRPTNG